MNLIEKQLMTGTPHPEESQADTVNSLEDKVAEMQLNSDAVNDNDNEEEKQHGGDLVEKETSALELQSTDGGETEVCRDIPVPDPEASCNVIPITGPEVSCDVIPVPVPDVSCDVTHTEDLVKQDEQPALTEDEPIPPKAQESSSSLLEAASVWSTNPSDLSVSVNPILSTDQLPQVETEPSALPPSNASQAVDPSPPVNFNIPSTDQVSESKPPSDHPTAVVDQTSLPTADQISVQADETSPVQE